MIFCISKDRNAREPLIFSLKVLETSIILEIYSFVALLGFEIENVEIFHLKLPCKKSQIVEKSVDFRKFTISSKNKFVLWILPRREAL